MIDDLKGGMPSYQTPTESSPKYVEHSDSKPYFLGGALYILYSLDNRKYIDYMFLTHVSLHGHQRLFFSLLGSLPYVGAGSNLEFQSPSEMCKSSTGKD